MKKLLLIHGGEGGRTAKMADAVEAGAAEFDDAVTVRRLPALVAGIDDLLWSDALLIGTPEKFGYLSGAVKEFLDRTFYPAQGRVDGLPWAMFVSAGNDGSGAVRALERIALGYRWKKVAEALIVVGEPDSEALGRCRELGQTFAAGLAIGAL